MIFLDIHKLHLIFAKYTSKEVNNIFQKKIDTKKLVYLKKKIYLIIFKAKEIYITLII